VAIFALVALVALGSCSSSAPSTTIELETLNGSGVTGTVVLTPISNSSTRVEISVQTGGNLDMPAHVHPGSCADLVPQPKYPLQNVVNGVSSTVVPAGTGELLAGDLAVNLHRSNEDMGTYTACADLR
jgi:hypothetical protein